EIKYLLLEENDFSFHKGQVADTRKFDPSHISLKNIQINLSDILIREDTLAAGLKSLSIQLPGFTLTNASAGIQMDRNQMALSELHLASGTNELQANLGVPLNLSVEQNVDLTHLEIAALGHINPTDLAYFFPDSIMNLFSPWGLTELLLEGDYSTEAGELKTLELKTGNSQLHAAGMVNNIFDPEKTSWENMVVTASIGSDFIRALKPFLGNSNFPPFVNLQMKSSGNLKKASLDGRVFTRWGDVKAIGQLSLQPDKVGIDMRLDGERVNLRELTNQSWLGPMNVSLGIKGIIGSDQNVEIKGLIKSLHVLDQSINNIAFQTRVRESEATVAISVEDPKYASKINSEISFAGPLIIKSDFEIEQFMLGDLLDRDSTLAISGRMKSKLILEESSMEGFVEAKEIAIKKQFQKYLIDTLAFHGLTSPTVSDIEYFTNQGIGKLELNFDARELPEAINKWLENLQSGSSDPIGSKTATFNIEMGNAILFQLIGIDVEDFSSLKVTGEFDEQQQRSALQVASGKFNGYGILLDSMNTTLMAFQDSVSATIRVNNLFYNSVPLSNLDIGMRTRGDTLMSNLILSNDSVILLGFQARILPRDDGVFLYPDSLKVFDNDYFVDPKNPVFLSTKNIVLNHFQIKRDDMQITLDGDLNAFNVALRNIDLTGLNNILSGDSAVINKGKLSANMSYSLDQHLNLKANIDSLSLYNSNPLSIAATAVSDGDKLPFEFLLTNESNKVDLKGEYFLSNEEVAASMLLDVNNLELFSFLVSDFIEEMNGTLKGEAKVSGSIKKPDVTGQLEFQNVDIKAVNPPMNFTIPDDRIVLDNSSMVFNNFKMHDQE
ncbi:MAG: hypothetical protein OEU76_07835, partial [Cyclobacteriaceae bacterium]|nr:hypothetical protein [Cyclobacteriaceae bacterium]